MSRMPRPDSEKLKPSASNTSSRNDSTAPGRPLDIPRKSRPLESGYHGIRIAGPGMVLHPREVSRHTVAQWQGLVTPEGPFASSSSLDGSLPRFAQGDEIPIIQTSLCDMGGSYIGGSSLNNIGISWSPSSSFIGGSPSTTAESTNHSHTLSTSDLGNQYSPTGLQPSSTSFALSQGSHLRYLRVPEHGVRRDNVTSSEISRFMGEILNRTADEGHRGTESTMMQFATTAPTLDVPVASETRGRLVAALHHNTFALAGDESGPSLLSLTRPPPSDGPNVDQPVAQPSIPALPPGLDSVCDSPWSTGGSSRFRDVTSPQNISPGLLNLGPTVHGPIRGTSKQRSTPSSAPHPTTNRPPLGFDPLQFNSSTWPMIAENRVEQKRNRTIPRGDIMTNYTTANNTYRRSLVPAMRPNAHEAMPKADPRSSLSLHPHSQLQPQTEFGAKTVDNDTSVTNSKDSLPINFPARSTKGISFGWVAPITRSTGSVSSLGQHSINLSNASGDAEITSQGFAHYSEGCAVEQPALLKGYQGSQTNSSGDSNYIAQISSESSVNQISATEMQRPPEIPSLAEYVQSDYYPFPLDDSLPTAIPFITDQSRGPAITGFLDPYSIFSGRDLSGVYQGEGLSATPEHAALGAHGEEELHRDVLPERSVLSRVALLKSPASSATSEPRSSQYTATPEFSHSPSLDFPAGSSTALQRDQTNSEQHYADLAEQIKRILEKDYHRGETTDWCIVYSGIIRRMRTGVSTRVEIAEAMARYLRPPIPNGFKDYLKRRISHVLSHNKHIFVKAEGGEKRHGWKIRQ